MVPTFRGVLGGAAGLGGVVGCTCSSSPLSIFNMCFVPPLGIDHLLCAYFSYPFSWVARPHRLGPIFLITVSCILLALRRFLILQANRSMWHLSNCHIHLVNIGSLWQLVTGES